MLDYLLIYIAISLFTTLLTCTNENLYYQINGKKTIGQSIMTAIFFAPAIVICGTMFCVVKVIELPIVGLWKILGKLGRRR